VPQPFQGLVVTGEVDSEHGTDAIDNEQSVAACGKVLIELNDVLILELTVLSADGSDIVASLLRVEAESPSDLLDSLRAKSSFSV
jgi:hypothetical protein